MYLEEMVPMDGDGEEWRWCRGGEVQRGVDKEQTMDVVWKEKSKGRDLSLWCPVRPFVQQGRTKPGRRWA